MLCKFPVDLKGGGCRKCGQCLPCVINERRVWTHRIMLESMLYAKNAFVTLTLRDVSLPDNRSVNPDHHRLFINNLRTQWYDLTGDRIRYYMCGEYGDKTFRPHYHYALFNFPTCLGPGPTYVSKKYFPCRCRVCEFVSKIWGRGHVFIGNLEADSAAYVAGYVTKKLTKPDDPRLVCSDGSILHPEFSRKSTVPGLGFDAVPAIYQMYVRCKLPDLPCSLKHSGKSLPLGRFMMEKLYAYASLPKPPAVRSEIAGLSRLFASIKNDPLVKTAMTRGSFGVGMQLANATASLQIEQRNKLKEKFHEI